MRLASVATLAWLTACGGGGGGDGGGAAPVPASVSSVTVSPAAPKYSQSALVTVNGANLDRGLSVVSAGCKDATLSTTAPNVSNASTAYYKCTVSAVGANRVDVSATGGGAVLMSANFTVATPQVTVTLSNGIGGTVNGDIVLALDPAKTPITVDNFLAYVNAGFYSGTIMHRVVPSFVVQGGGFLPLNGGTTPVAKATRPPITLEVGKGLSNLQWTVAMARSAQADSATSQFFINLVDNVALDTNSGGYAVFGSVAAGTAVVSALAGVNCAAAIANFSECPPATDVVITSASQTQ
jgi:cyclophilin family peptidyl-prolyl cis-trans isomerase